MDSRWRNMAAIILVLAAAAAAFLFLPSLASPSFDAEAGEMQETWLAKGIDVQNFSSNSPESLSSLSKAELGEMQASFSAIAARQGNSEEEEAAARLANAYHALAGFIKHTNAADAAAAKIDETKPCSSIPAMKEKNMEEAAKIESIRAFASSKASFAEMFPEKARETGLLYILLNVGERQQNLEENREIVAMLEANCQ